MKTIQLNDEDINQINKFNQLIDKLVLKGLNKEEMRQYQNLMTEIAHRTGYLAR